MRVIIFAGTAEGARLCRYIDENGICGTVCVATEYGKAVLEGIKNIEIKTGRIDKNGMVDIIKYFDIVIDATHPYAVEATKNISEASNILGKRYIRLLRPSIQFNDGIYVKDVKDAVEILNRNNDRAFITTGSNELEHFTRVKNFSERLFIRVLPAPDVIQKCISLGFKREKIVAIQGPFSEGFNLEIMKWCKAKYLVTKDTGKEGGFEQKVNAAKSLGCKVIVISRQINESGLPYEEVIKILSPFSKSNRSFMKFPIFIDISGKNVVIIGNGNVAKRRIDVLLKYGADITVVSPEGGDNDNVNYICRKYQRGDIEGADIAIAATNDRCVNETVYRECTQLGIPVSVSDCPKECTFFFPAIVNNEKLSIGIVSDGSNHFLVSETAEKIRRIV